MVLIMLSHFWKWPYDYTDYLFHTNRRNWLCSISFARLATVQVVSRVSLVDQAKHTRYVIYQMLLCHNIEMLACIQVFFFFLYFVSHRTHSNIKWLCQQSLFMHAACTIWTWSRFESTLYRIAIKTVLQNSLLSSISKCTTKKINRKTPLYISPYKRIYSRYAWQWHVALLLL